MYKTNIVAIHSQIAQNKTTVFEKRIMKLFTLNTPLTKQLVSEKRIRIGNRGCSRLYVNSSHKKSG
jgi:hypothetical protein